MRERKIGWVREGSRTAVVQDSVQTFTPLSSLLRSRPAHRVPQFSQEASTKRVKTIKSKLQYRILKFQCVGKSFDFKHKWVLMIDLTFSLRVLQRLYGVKRKTEKLQTTRYKYSNTFLMHGSSLTKPDCILWSQLPPARFKVWKTSTENRLRLVCVGRITGAFSHWAESLNKWKGVTFLKLHVPFCHI